MGTLASEPLARVTLISPRRLTLCFARGLPTLGSHCLFLPFVPPFLPFPGKSMSRNCLLLLHDLSLERCLPPQYAHTWFLGQPSSSHSPLLYLWQTSRPSASFINLFALLPPFPLVCPVQVRLIRHPSGSSCCCWCASCCCCLVHDGAWVLRFSVYRHAGSCNFSSQFSTLLAASRNTWFQGIMGSYPEIAGCAS